MAGPLGLKRNLDGGHTRVSGRPVWLLELLARWAESQNAKSCVIYYANHSVSHS
jgi:hypothetical protein